MIPSSVSAKIPSLREEHGDIYFLDISELRTDKLTSCVVLKPLTRREFNSFSEDTLIDPIAAIKILLKRCVVYGIKYTNESRAYLAGVDEFVSDAIRKISGFSTEDDLTAGVEDARTEALTLEAAITVMICKAFPTLTPEDVDRMTFKDQMRYTALAEQILQVPLPYDEFLSSDKPTKIEDIEPPPPPEGYMSHGGKRPPIKRPDKNVMVTPENLQTVMSETRDVFSR